jgi:hypothetical protein
LVFIGLSPFVSIHSDVSAKQQAEGVRLRANVIATAAGMIHRMRARQVEHRVIIARRGDPAHSMQQGNKLSSSHRDLPTCKCRPQGRAASGHATAPPSSVMKSRRLQSVI